MKRTRLFLVSFICLLVGGCDTGKEERAMATIAKACDSKISMKIVLGGWSNQVEMYCEDVNLKKKESK
jgi:hypothetical protein